MKKSKRKVVFYVILVIICWFCYSGLVIPKRTKNIVNPVNGGLISTNVKNKINLTLNNTVNAYNFSDSALTQIVKRDLNPQNGNYAVVIEPLSLMQGKKTASAYYQNQNTKFPSASLYKLFVMAAALKEIENGNLQDNTNLSSSVSHLADVLGSKEFGYDDNQMTVSMSVSQSLERIASVSDNYAAVLLAEKVGWDNVQSQANEIGANSTTIKSPITTSASDIALFFRKLYDKQIVSPSASDRIIQLLSISRLNNRIPAKLPAGVKVAHKTGELSGVRNDAGIVFLNNCPYIIVMMSKDLKSEDDAISDMAILSKDVFDYFSISSK